MSAIRSAVAALVAGLALLAAAGPAGAQDSTLMRGFTLEQDGNFREAAIAYRAALAGEDAVGALLGLERAYAALGHGDSLLPVLDSLLRVRPAEPTFRTAQLRTLQTLGREADVREAFEQWVRAAPGESAPFREYVRMLLAAGRVAIADSVLRRARGSVRSENDLAYETAQLRAASGEWMESAESWRVALRSMAYLQQAAIYALVRAPESARAEIRRVLALPPAEHAPRIVLAALELSWGDPAQGWDAIRMLPRGDSAVAAWTDYAKRAEAAGAWLVARDALAAVLAVKPQPSIALRAIEAALNGGDAASALALSESATRGLDSAAAARGPIPFMVRALGILGRPGDAERVATAYGPHLVPSQREELARQVAWAWVRSGDLARAREVLGETAGAAEGEAHGWMALYEGDLGTARTALRRAGEDNPAAVAALALIMRTRADTGRQLGQAFLRLARGDTVGAAAAFVAAERELPDAGALLLATAARLHAARGDDQAAEPLWSAIARKYESTPEAAEADLERARILRRRGDGPAAITLLEHLILTYPGSALVPQARRELELARNRIPDTR